MRVREIPLIFFILADACVLGSTILDESLLGGSFVEKVKEHWWPNYSMCFGRAAISAPSFRPRGHLRVFPPARNFLRGSRARTTRCHSQSWGLPLSRVW